MFLIAILLSCANPSDRWFHLGGSTDLYEEHLDKESIRRSGGKVTLWTRRQDLAEGSTVWNELEFDCSMRTETVLAFVRDDGGTISHNVARPHREAAPIPARSVKGKIFALVCG